MSNFKQNYNQAQQNGIQPRKPKFSAIIQTPAYQKSLQNSLSNPKEIQKFTAAITSVVSTNPDIEECDASTILSAALCGHALGLAPSPQAVNDGEVYEAIVNSYKTAEILYIDDFFKTRRGDFVSTADVNATFKIINYRYNEELPTIISSELSIQQIVEIDEALGSRIAELANHKVFIEKDPRKNYRFRDKKVS